MPKDLKRRDFPTGAAIASAATVNLNAATGNRVHITGTTAITAVTLTGGPVTLIFDGVLTLTHHTTNNKLPGGANITTAAGDVAVYEGDGTTVRCVIYTRADGTAIAATWGALSGKPNTVYGLQGVDATSVNPNTRIGTGFYEQGTAATANGWPVNGGWWHLLSLTHSNASNYYAMQFAADFNAQDLRFRTTGDNGLRAWSSVLLSSNFGTWAQPAMTSASQAEMEAGTEAALRAMSPLRVAQAVAALSSSGGNTTQEFASSGNWTLTGTWALVELWGAGGGGGGGRRGATSSTRSGGSGGGGGGYACYLFKVSDLSGPVAVTIGAGGTAGAAPAGDSTNGGAGGNGGNTTFGSYLTAKGGSLGLGGIASQGTGGAGGTFDLNLPSAFRGGAGVIGTAGDPGGWGGGAGGGATGDSFGGNATGGNSLTGSGGGGAGGGLASNNFARGPSIGGARFGGGAAGTVTPNTTAEGSSSATTSGTAGGNGGVGAGGGGGSSGGGAGGTGANGGNGGIGGGGGGGGASFNGNAAGAGGAGGPGFCRITSW